MPKTFKQEDVLSIKNPAYVVREHSHGGCVVEWNEEFRTLSNFTPEDIDNKWCYELICGVREFDDKLEELCQPECTVRKTDTPSVYRGIWINSKDQRGEDIKKKVDIYIFPYTDEKDGGKYALHILFDKQHSHSYVYFWKRFQGKFKINFPSTIDIFRISFPMSCAHMEKAGIFERFEKEVFR